MTSRILGTLYTLGVVALYAGALLALGYVGAALLLGWGDVVTDRELDALVSEKVMGWTLTVGAGFHNGEHWWKGDTQRRVESVWSPSTSIADALGEVAERFDKIIVFRDRDRIAVHVSRLENAGHWSERWAEGACKVGETETLPRAICLAALRAVGMEVPE